MLSIRDEADEHMLISFIHLGVCNFDATALTQTPKLFPSRVFRRALNFEFAMDKLKTAILHQDVVLIWFVGLATKFSHSSNVAVKYIYFPSSHSMDSK